MKVFTFTLHPLGPGGSTRNSPSSCRVFTSYIPGCEHRWTFSFSHPLCPRLRPLVFLLLLIYFRSAHGSSASFSRHPTPRKCCGLRTPLEVAGGSHAPTSISTHGTRATLTTSYNTRNPTQTHTRRHTDVQLYTRYRIGARQVTQRQGDSVLLPSAHEDQASR